MAQTTTHTSVSKMKRFLEEFRKLDKEIPSQQIYVFLLVADKPNISMRELIAITGHSSSTVSRNVAALGSTHRTGEPGHDLVISYDDPLDSRNKLVRMNHKGETFLNRLVHIMEN